MITRSSALVSGSGGEFTPVSLAISEQENEHAVIHSLCDGVSSAIQPFPRRKGEYTRVRVVRRRAGPPPNRGLSCLCTFAVV